MKIAQTSTSTWEGTFPDLRKRARQLENEIDSKLANLNKLGVSVSDPLSRLNLRFTGESTSSEEASLYSAQSTFNVLSAEIEQLLTKLTEINDQMSQYVAGASAAASNPALSHTMQRHRDILRDYCHEFQRMQSNIGARMEREQLLSSTKNDSTASDNFLNRREDLYSKEHDHIRSSDRLLDEQISIAISTKDHLHSQRGGLKDISKKIYQLTKRYPAINSVMQKINWRKRRDTIIIGLVISVCLILSFIYAMS